MSSKKQDPELAMKRRFRIVYFAVICVGLVLLGRMFDLQIVNGTDYEGEAQDNRTRILTIPAARGRILDINGKVLADTRQALAVVLFDLHNGNMQQVAPILVSILDDPKVVADAVYDSVYAFREVYRLEPYILARDITEKQQAMIMERIDQLPGVRIESIPVREYPQNELLSHTIGHLGPLDEDDLAGWAKDEGYRPGDLVGRMGLERSYEEELRGTPGFELVEVDASQNIVRIIDRQPAQAGNDIYLTIDSDLQRQAELSLIKSLSTMRLATPIVRAPSAYSGSVVAVEPKSGRILAMASYPDFSPNDFATGSLSDEAAEKYFNNQVEGNSYPRPMVNRSIIESLPPGSVYKPVTLAAALEKGVVGLRETVFCSGLYTGVEFTTPPKCWVFPGQHNSVYGSQALRDSCNCYFYEMGKRLYEISGDNDALDSYAAAFGLGEDTGFTDLDYSPESDIESTRRSNLATKRWEHELWDVTGTPVEEVEFYQGEACFSAIGQAFNAFTPLQITMMTAQIANMGVRYKPFIVDKIVSPQGEIVYQANILIQDTIILKDSTWTALHDGLKMVTDLQGTSYSCTVGYNTVRPWSDLPFKVAAKTGTAQIANDPNDERAHAWFTAFAPADDPQIAIAMVVENGRSGSNACGPTVSNLIRTYTNHVNLTLPFIEDPTAPWPVR